MRWKFCLKIILILLLSPVALNASAEVRISIPAISLEPIVCRPGSSFLLGPCLNEIIENKLDSNQKLVISIKSGKYILTEPVFFFQRDNIVLQSDERENTRIYLGAEFQSTSKKMFYYYTFQIIDSNNITIRGLKLEGMNAVGQRGISICPTGKNKLHDITITENEAKGFLGNFTIIGNSIGHEHLINFHSPRTKTEKRIFEYLHPQGSSQTQQHFYCSGTVKNILFSKNHLFLKSVGFYLAPLSVIQTEKYNILSPPFLRYSKGADDWLAVSKHVTELNSQIQILDNNFISDIHQSDFKSTSKNKSAELYKKNLDQEFHSFVKVQQAGQIRIAGNTFDSTNNDDTFLMGGAINIAANTMDITIQQNKILFSPTHKYSPKGVYSQGITVNNAFSAHELFGLGAIVPKELKEVEGRKFGLFGPVIGLRIEDNQLQNTRVRLFDVCSDRELDTAGYCKDLDQHQRRGDEKYEHIVIRRNRFNGSYLKADKLIVTACREWLKCGTKEADTERCRLCRSKLGIEPEV